MIFLRPQRAHRLWLPLGRIWGPIFHPARRRPLVKGRDRTTTRAPVDRTSGRQANECEELIGGRFGPILLRTDPLKGPAAA